MGEGQPTLASARGRNLRVFVIDSRGNALMPTYPQKARKLLERGKAKVTTRTPFTIQLTEPSGGNKQSISLGVDAGTKRVGLSATTTKEVLYEAEATLRIDIQDLLASRKQFRRARRSRKTRYRQPRFLNRKNRKGKLPPSVQNKVDTHVKLIKQVYGILPITNIVVEAAQFDIQKILNPEIQGIGYQQGPQLNFWNVREYVLWRDNHRCQHCKGKSKDKILNVHHVESRKTGGDSPDNLITLCKTCHDTVHQEKLINTFKRGRPFRDATQMNSMRKFLFVALKTIYPDVQETYGYITKHTRIENGLEKSHMVDARCIGGNSLAIPIETTFRLKQVRGQNRQLHKANILKNGVRKANKASRYCFGFQLFDKVKFKGQECFVFGRRSSGPFDVRLLDGTKVNAGVSYKKLLLLSRATTMLKEQLNLPRGFRAEDR